METIHQDQLDALVRLHERFLTGRIGGRRATLRNTDLSGLSLKNMDLRQADFTGCIMRNMNLSGANFQEASLYACDLANSNLNKANFVRADLRGARIENANLEHADLEAADLRVGGINSPEGRSTSQSVNFRGANLSCAKLIGTLAGSADFSDAIMSGAKVSNADLRGAKFEGADLSDADLGGCQMQGANLKSAIMTGVKLDTKALMGIDLSDAITDQNIGKTVSSLDKPLQHLIDSHRSWVKSAGKDGVQLDLSGYDLRELRTLKMEKLTAIKAVNAKFFGMNLYKIEMQSALLDKSDFRRCDIEGADMRGASFRGANFSHANLKGANFDPLLFGAEGAHQRFSPCHFEESILRYANFESANLKNAVFKGADLTYANFKGANLRGADFEGAVITGVVFEGADMSESSSTQDETVGSRAFSLKSLKQDD
jgi:uncharacterized protein YjbI with pentapeptide repeats